MTKKFRFKTQGIISMTFDEIVRQYNGIIKKEITHWSRIYDSEDLYQTGLIGLWEAYCDYDLSKKVLFTTYATLRVKWKFYKYHHESYEKHRKAIGDTLTFVSFDYMPLDAKEHYLSKIRYGTNLQAMEENLLEEFWVEQLFGCLLPQERIVLDQLMAGKKQIEIAKELGVSRQRVSQLKTKLSDKLKNHILSEEKKAKRRNKDGRKY